MAHALFEIGAPDTMKPVNGPQQRPVEEGRRGLAAMLAAARREFVSDVDNGLGGRSTQERLAARMDEIVLQIVEAAQTKSHLPEPVAVCAIGGYGRGTMCLHSDVDLLILFGGRVGRPEERFVKGVLHPLWDLGLTVGNQIRALGEPNGVDADNREFLLALADARPLAGDESLLARAHARFGTAAPQTDEAILEALLQLLDERLEKYNDTIYQLEPDVKEAPGGLRDVAAALMLASAAPQELLPIDRERLLQAEEFLLRVRAALHVEAGRQMNVLTHELQERVAERFKMPGRKPALQVEALMGEYFRHARVVERVRRRARRLAGSAERDTTRVLLEDNIELMADGIAFVDRERAGKEPQSWLRAFELALDRRAPVSDETLSMFETQVVHYDWDDFLGTAESRDRLMHFLRPRFGLYARLSEIHDCGLLERLVPPFKAISGRVIRDFYHKYTVDEHTLLTIRGLERLLSPDKASRDRFSSLLHELPAPELLVLSLLLHDVGKWKEDNHAEESERMAETMLDRLELSNEARQEVRFLIGQHLQMSRRAFRRDSEDPGIVGEFASLVGTEERLKLLCLMTLVDIDAVSPDALSAWKEEVLWRLYVDTYNELTLGYADARIEEGQAAVAALQTTRPADIGEQELATFLEGLPRRYLAAVDADHIYHHARLSRDMHPDEVHLFLEQKRDVWELAVATLDKPFLFSNISGVLSYCGVDILRGSAMTSPTGLVLDIFQFNDDEGFFRLNPEALSRVKALLEEVVAGRLDAADLIQRKERGLLSRRGQGRVAPIVYFDHEHSERYTVLEIVAQNAVGLLFRISRVISRHGCDLDLVLISTEGNKAIDVFHLTKGAAKLTLTDQMALKVDLESMLEEV